MSRHIRTLGSNENILKDFESLKDTYIRYMFARTCRMFEYKNLPSTIPSYILEKILQMGGYGFIKEVNGEYYAFFNGLGGILNEYHLPTDAIVSNPYLKEFSVNEIDTKEGVLIRNDSSHLGLYAMFERYATLIAHIDISLKWQTIISRIPKVLTGDDENQVSAINKYLNAIEGGNLIGVASSNFNAVNEINTLDFNSNTNNQIKNLIEERQYYWASWLNELGLQANFNMKRESLNSSETSLNEESLKPLCDDMLKQREEGVKKLNEIFGLNIKVKYSSSWINRKEIVSDDIINEEGKKEDEEGNQN